MATYSVEELFNHDQRDEKYFSLSPADAITIAEFVMDNFPAVFDQAAAKVDRINAQLAELHSKQEESR